MASPPEKNVKIRTILPAARGRVEKYEALADGHVGNPLVNKSESNSVPCKASRSQAGGSGATN